MDCWSCEPSSLAYMDYYDTGMGSFTDEYSFVDCIFEELLEMEMMIPKPTKQPKEKKPLKKKSTTSVSKAKKKAWDAFSFWVRISGADGEGYVKCVTCTIKKPYKEMQAGHFIPGRNNSVLFSEDGVHPQCYQCNVSKKGNWPEYYSYMMHMYGQEVIDELLLESKKIRKYILSDYIELEIYYKKKISEL